jgi:hypothetical protein
MDFTNDACMNLFTNGQKTRMLALFQPGGERFAILSSTVLTATAIPVPVENAVADISIYPNPSLGNVTVQLSDNIDIGSELDIYNLVGQKISSAIVQRSQFELNISSFSKGVYFIKVNDGKNRIIAKLMKL